MRNQQGAEKKTSFSRGAGAWAIGGESLLAATKRFVSKVRRAFCRRTRQASTAGELRPRGTATFPPSKLPCCRPHRSRAGALAMQQSKDGEKCCTALPFTLSPLFTYIVTNFSARNGVMNTARARLPCCLKLLLSHLEREISERTAAIAQSIFRGETHHLIIIYLT